MKRVTWDECWMEVADAVARRSGCERRQVGAVVVDKHNRIVATGYNGPPAGLLSTDSYGACTSTRKATCGNDCPRGRGMTASGIVVPATATYGNCISIHAEANALLFCDRRDREGGTIYITTSACWDCAKQISNSGLRRVVMRLDPERDAHRNPEDSVNMLKDSGIRVTIWKDIHEDRHL